MKTTIKSLPQGGANCYKPTITNISSFSERFISRNFEEWANQFGGLNFRVSNAGDIMSKRKMSLEDFLTQTEEKGKSTFDSASLTMTPDLIPLIPFKLPPIPIEDLYEGLHDKLNLNLLWIIFGLKGSRNPMHTDIWSTSTWNLLLFGKKEWKIQSRDNSINFRIEQKPGDVLHIPSGWAHEVKYIVDSVSVSENYVQPELWEKVSDHQFHEGLIYLSKITRKLGVGT